MKNRIVITAVAIGFLLMAAGWTTRMSAGSKQTFINITSSGVYAFPWDGTATLTSPFAANTIWQPSFSSWGRYEGDGATPDTLVVYWSNGVTDTVFVSPLVIELTSPIDSVSVGLVTGSKIQAEGSN